MLDRKGAKSAVPAVWQELQLAALAKAAPPTEL
jgi:hypothetical protein